jgi:hypothetical protein
MDRHRFTCNRYSSDNRNQPVTTRMALCYTDARWFV